MKFTMFAVLLFVFFNLSCHSFRGHSQYGSGGRQPANQALIRANVEFLADDALEGREAGTRGEVLASLFIASEFKKYGLQPYGANQNFFQNFYLEKTRFDESSCMVIRDSSGNMLYEFEHGEDFVGSNRFFSHIDTTTGLAFAGYGIDAAEYNYNDYGSLDVRGRVVLLRLGEPEGPDSVFFEGAKRTGYSSSRYKLDRAAEAGAVGVIFLSWGEKRIGWDGVREYEKKGGVRLWGRVESSRLPNISVSEQTMQKIFELDGKDYDKIIADGSGFLLRNTVSVSWGFSGTDTVLSRNILGLISGNDRSLADEFVAVGAHYDHIGISEAGVFNGADDNASGTAAVLEAARLLAADNANKRSVLVALYSAEEKGLLGSRYLTDSLSTIGQVVAAVNLDMIGRGPADSIYSIGSDKISKKFHQLVEEANRNSTQFYFDYTLNAPDEPQRLYYRSDHYNYARLGIPIVFFFDYQMQDYHKVTDDVEKLNLVKIARMAELTREIALGIANHPHRLDQRNIAGNQPDEIE